MEKAKPFEISKQVVWEAWEQVKANRGAAGVDAESIADFEASLKDNLYKIWNRMTSGSYFPPAVRTVAIPKKNGGERLLSIPTVSDRVAQMVRWATRKFKRFRGHRQRAEHWLGRIAKKQPWLFPHWQMGIKPTAG